MRRIADEGRLPLRSYPIVCGQGAAPQGHAQARHVGGRSTTAALSLLRRSEAHERSKKQSGRHPRRHRWLDLRALAQQLLSRRPQARRGAGLCQPPRHQHRGQRHVLPHAEPCELSPLGGGDAGRFRVFGEGQPLRHQPQGPGRGRAGDRPFRGKRDHRARAQARTDPLAAGTDQKIRCGGDRALLRASAEIAGRPQIAPRAGGAACEFRRRRVRGPGTRAWRGDLPGGFGGLSADRRRHRRLRLSAPSDQHRGSRGGLRPDGDRAFRRARENLRGGKNPGRSAAAGGGAAGDPAIALSTS